MEGYNGANGWAIGDLSIPENHNIEDIEDAETIYSLLEREIVPLYYNTDRDGTPRGWVNMMREAIRTSSAQFSMARMLKDYTNDMYLQAMQAPEMTY